MTPTQAGHIVGTAAGAVVGQPAIGALVGIAAGMLLNEPWQQAMERKERKTLEEQMAQPLPQQPALSGPGHYETVLQPTWVETAQLKRVWVDDVVTNHAVIPGHFDERPVPTGSWVDVPTNSWIPDPEATPHDGSDRTTHHPAPTT